MENKDLKDISLESLQKEAVELGIPAEAVSSFTSKKQVQIVIDSLKAKSDVSEERVKSLEEKETPQEAKAINKQWLTKAERMRAKLMSQEMVSFLQPLEAKEKVGVVRWEKDKNGVDYQVHVSGDILEVQLNGFKWLVPKGVMTRVPRQVAEELGLSMDMTQQAGRDISLDRIDEKTGKAMSDIL